MEELPICESCRIFHNKLRRFSILLYDGGAWSFCEACHQGFLAGIDAEKAKRNDQNAKPRKED